MENYLPVPFLICICLILVFLPGCGNGTSNSTQQVTSVFVLTETQKADFLALGEQVKAIFEKPLGPEAAHADAALKAAFASVPSIEVLNVSVQTREFWYAYETGSSASSYTLEPRVVLKEGIYVCEGEYKNLASDADAAPAYFLMIESHISADGEPIEVVCKQ